jgi:hypothetical protein
MQATQPMRQAGNPQNSSSIRGFDCIRTIRLGGDMDVAIPNIRVRISADISRLMPKLALAAPLAVVADAAKLAPRRTVGAEA